SWGSAPCSPRRSRPGGAGGWGFSPRTLPRRAGRRTSSCGGRICSCGWRGASSGGGAPGRRRRPRVPRGGRRRQPRARGGRDTAARIKEAFSATLSHELRTPLSAILGWGKVLRTRPSESAVLVEGLNAIVDSCQSLSHLVDDLLDSSRIAAGKLRLEMAETEVGRVVAAAVETIRPTADAKGVILRSGPSEDRCTVMADPERLRQVLWNLLANAVKFTPAGGTVSVTEERAGSDLIVVVADTGAGIDPLFLPHVFDRFRQYQRVSGRRGG